MNNLNYEQLFTEYSCNHLPPELVERMIKDRKIRIATSKQSFFIFFHFYLAHYVKFQTAPFHREIFYLAEQEHIKSLFIAAFRGSSKSTILTTAYPMWAILGTPKRKFVLIICETQAQARQHMANLRKELETNTLLKNDLGPFREESIGEWAMSSIVFQNTGARITIASIDQSIRGIRHYQHRPDLIILDDIEDLNSTKTLESRNKTFDWFTREVVPLGDLGTRIIAVGNLLHEDALMMRLKKKIDLGDFKGVFRRFPLLDENGTCLWPGKFDTEEKIDDLRQSIPSEIAWQQEFLLNIVSDSSRVIFPEWIRYYDELPNMDLRSIHVGVDLAISQREGADFTAMVGLRRYGYGNNMRLYVIPNPFNKRVPFPEVVATIQNLDRTFKAKDEHTKFIVESNGFQEIYVQAVSDAGCDVEGVKHTGDKRSRLALVSKLIQDGSIVFPRQGAEELVAQLTGFGIENHDDLADGFSTAVLDVMDDIQNDRSWEAWMQWVKSNGGSMWI